MNFTRRGFLKTSTAAAAASVIPTSTYDALAKNVPANFRAGKMKLTFRPFTIELRHVFTLSVMSRTTTPVVLT